MTIMFALYVIKTANSLFGHSDNAAMFSFGEFFSLEGILCIFFCFLNILTERTNVRSLFCRGDE